MDIKDKIKLNAKIVSRLISSDTGSKISIDDLVELANLTKMLY